MFVHVGEFFEQKIQEMIVRIDTKKISPMLSLHDEVLVSDHVRDDADREKRETFEQFEDGDEHQTARTF